jgi:hypothetical protein
MARTLRIPASFLGDGTYRVLLVRDDPAEPAALKVEELTASRGDPIEINLRPAGGFIARFTQGNGAGSAERK